MTLDVGMLEQNNAYHFDEGISTKYTTMLVKKKVTFSNKGQK